MRFLVKLISGETLLELVALNSLGGSSTFWPWLYLHNGVDEYMGKKKKVKALPRKRPVHRVNVTYTMEERSKILVKMTPEQQEAYTASIQLTFSDRVMNTVFEEAPHWKFVGIQVDYGWEYRKTHPEKSANLKCVCGRQLRYQYQLISTDGRHRRINLGSSHFM